MAFVMAAVLAGLVTFLVFKRVRESFGQRAMTQLVATANDLPAGVALSQNDVVMIDWPTNVPLAGSYTKLDQVVGHPLLHSMGAKQPILQRDLGVEGSGIGLATKIPAGMRATAVRSNEVAGVAGFLYPGSRVDVLGTYVLPGNANSLTQTVLQDVEVLTAGQTIEPDPKGAPQTVNVVTLLLTPEDSQKLQLATTQGTIQFVLRNGTDQKSVSLPPTTMDKLIATVKPPEAPKTIIKRVTAAPPPPKPVYMLEVIQGTKSTVHKFDEVHTEQGNK